jgi:hypothetical protein
MLFAPLGAGGVQYSFINDPVNSDPRNYYFLNFGTGAVTPSRPDANYWGVSATAYGDPSLVDYVIALGFQPTPTAVTICKDINAKTGLPDPGTLNSSNWPAFYAAGTAQALFCSSDSYHTYINLFYVAVMDVPQ